MISMIMFSINNAQQNKPLILQSEVRHVPDNFYYTDCTLLFFKLNTK